MYVYNLYIRIHNCKSQTDSVESERAKMSKDLFEGDRQLKQFIMSITKFIETLQV